MARRYNPEYIRTIMQKPFLAAIEVCIIATEGRFGVSSDNHGQFKVEDFVDAEPPDGYDSGIRNYTGWSTPGRLYCVKCWSPIHGVPRDILASNRCPSCGRQLYDPDDTQLLDKMGFRIYRKHVSRYTELGLRCFADLAQGAQHLRPRRRGDYVGAQRGLHRDHMYSVRKGFENDVPASIIGSPPNIRVVPSDQNLAKKDKCACSLGELKEAYCSFVQVHPEWFDLLKKSDEEDATYFSGVLADEDLPLQN